MSGEQRRETDAVSIIALLTSVTCLLSPVGLVLGLVGLARTEQRRGRWAAVTATVAGVLGSFALAFGIFALLYERHTREQPEEAQVGDCLDVRPASAITAPFHTVSCSMPHDAEVFFVGRLSAQEAASGDLSGVCGFQLTGAYASAMASGDYVLFPATADEDVAAGSAYFCYVEPKGGVQLTGPLR